MRGYPCTMGIISHSDLVSPYWLTVFTYRCCWRPKRWWECISFPFTLSLKEAWGEPRSHCQVSVSSLDVHPATLSVGSHKSVSGTERRLLCKALPYPFYDPFHFLVNYSVRPVAVNDISPRLGGHRGKAKDGWESLLSVLRKQKKITVPPPKLYDLQVDPNFDEI